jgi:putative intracellular protease/amidase
LLEDGREVPKAALKRTADAALDKWLDEHREVVEKHTIALKICTPGMILRNKDTGATTLIRYAGLTLTYSLVQEEVPLKLSRYVDRDNQITDVAVADGPTGRIAIVYKESEGGSVMFQPRQSASAKAGSRRTAEARHSNRPRPQRIVR